ncbi:MAG: SDR family oxidoreductase [Gammaproteobacteria bacterium]|nr:SDR family oxidoreductase [Gammaproteobacteria bacterium]
MPVVLVTGCSSGLGAAAARAFAQAGYTVRAGVRRLDDAAELARAAGGSGQELLPVLIDVTDRDSIATAVARIIAEDGRIDVLVNNAGVTVTGAFEDMLEADLERVMRTNFHGPLWLTRAVLPHMRAQGGGTVIMMSSLSALVGLPGESIYSASKAALEHAAEALRREVARFGIRVCVVEPGLYRTRMPEKMLEARSCPPGSPYAPLIDHLLARLASRRGEGDDPAAVGALLVGIAALADPPLRIPAGAQAQAVVARLATLAPGGIDAFLDAVNDTGWWSAGAARPGSADS